MQKICPLMSREVISSVLWEKSKACADTKTKQSFVECQKSKCAFYVSGYTTEKSRIECCAFEFIALKNAEGSYSV